MLRPMTSRHRVVPALEHLLTPLADVRPHPKNARNGDVEMIGASLRKHGQYAPIVVQKSTGHVLKGNHVYAAMLEDEWTHGAVTVVDVDDETALRILLVDNRASDLGVYDDPLLAELLTTLTGLDADGLEGTGYDDRDLSRLLKRIEADAARDLSDLGDTDTAGLGENAVIGYSITFETTAQQNEWYALLKYLRGQNPDATIAERLLAWARATTPIADLS